jgi:hypothetical protein
MFLIMGADIPHQDLESVAFQLPQLQRASGKLKVAKFDAPQPEPPPAAAALGCRVNKQVQLSREGMSAASHWLTASGFRQQLPHKAQQHLTAACDTGPALTLN